MISSYKNTILAQAGSLFSTESPQIIEEATHPIVGGVSSFFQIILGLLGLVAIIFLIWGSFQYTTSQGDEEKVEASTKQMITAIVAVLVIILAFVFLRIVTNFLT